MGTFYGNLLPRQGVYCVATISPAGRVNHKFCESIEAVEASVAAFKDQGVNVYVAPNSFKSYSRTAENAAWARSFFIDLDVGEGKPYESQTDAVTALNRFIHDHELPPPLIINSGTGIQAYWVFNSDVAIEEWKGYANAFKQYLLREGLGIDPNVSADAARIMRSPGTFNHKVSPPAPTYVYESSVAYEYAFQSFKDFLGPLGDPNLPVLAAAVKNVPGALTLHNNFETVFTDLVMASFGQIPDMEGCGQIKRAIEHPNDLTYEQWFDALSIATRCTDGPTAIHLLSEDYDGYTREETEFKARETGGPHLCTTFDKNSPGICPSCPHWGKITTPLHITRKLKVAVAAEDSVTGVLSEPKKLTALPAELAPYQKGVNGGIYYVPPADRDDDGAVIQDPPQLLVDYDLYPVKRMISGIDGECLLMLYVTPHDGIKEFLLPLRDSYSPDTMVGIVVKNGVFVIPHMVRHLINYLVLWGKYMQKIQAAELMRMQMGWTEDKENFVVGLREFTSKGGERVAPASPYVRGITKHMIPTGDVSKWKESADALNEKGFELHAFAMLCGFGSPLMHLTSTTGVCVSYYGPTGAAKTGALYAGLSIFGNPKELSVFDATDNGGVQRMLNLHNIMLGRDEAGDMDPLALGKLIHNISHGKAKIRLQTSVNAEREYEMSASLIGFFTSNHSLYERMQERKAAPEGEMARLIEFYLEGAPKPIANDTLRGKKIFHTFNFNYGWAGPEYIKEIFRLGFPAVEARILKWSERFIKDFGSSNAYRFYDNLVSAVFAGGEIAQESKIINFDIERIYYEVVRRLCTIRDKVRLNEVDYNAIIGEFFNQHHEQFLIMDGDRVLQAPHRGIIGRIEVDTKMQYVSKKLFKQYLNSLQISSLEFEFTCSKENILAVVAKQKITRGWQAGYDVPQIPVYGFRANSDKLLDDVLKHVKLGG